jgi:hypothetical protein
MSGILDNIRRIGVCCQRGFNARAMLQRGQLAFPVLRRHFSENRRGIEHCRRPASGTTPALRQVSPEALKSWETKVPDNADLGWRCDFLATVCTKSQFGHESRDHYTLSDL